MIRGKSEIRDAYRLDSVAQNYVAERFTQPLGALLHDRQVDLVCAFIEKEQPHRVLELAPGPARLTRDVALRSRCNGVMVDASLQMLSEGRRRLETSSSRWAAVQGDAFSLPFAEPFGLVFSFRLIRHFERAERLRLYAQVHRILKPGGYFLFDSVNEVVSTALRAKNPSEYLHYDALMSPDAIRDELNETGFALTNLYGVQHRYPVLRQLQMLVAPRSRGLARYLMERVERLGGEPLEWIVACRRH